MKKDTKNTKNTQDILTDLVKHEYKVIANTLKDLINCNDTANDEFLSAITEFVLHQKAELKEFKNKI